MILSLVIFLTLVIRAWRRGVYMARYVPWYIGIYRLWMGGTSVSLPQWWKFIFAMQQPQYAAFARIHLVEQCLPVVRMRLEVWAEIAVDCVRCEQVRYRGHRNSQA